MEDVQERRRALRRLDDHLRSSGIYEPVIACQLRRACAVQSPAASCFVSVAQTLELQRRGESSGGKG